MKNFLTLFWREDNEKIGKDLEVVVGWHDRIAGLPEMDSKWTYQLEFGIDPVCLYQVRAFKKIEKASFIVPPNETYEDALVIGVTPPQGIDVRVETDLRGRYSDEMPINPDNNPSLLLSELRSATYIDKLRNHQANILYDSIAGLLSHSDVKAIRQASVTAIFHLSPHLDIEQGDWVNVKSDGENMEVTKVRPRIAKKLSGKN